MAQTLTEPVEKARCVCVSVIFLNKKRNKQDKLQEK